jgi:hypothetical protein
LKTDIQQQIELEKLFHKNQLFRRLKLEFSENGILDHMRAWDIPETFGLYLLSHMVLLKRTKPNVLIGILHPYVGAGTGHPVDLQETSDLIYRAAVANLVDWDAETKEIILRLNVSEDVHAEIERYQYPLPMIVEPQPLRKNDHSAYYTSKGSLILKSGNHHEDDICLDHLNRVNSVALTINPDTARMIKNQWKNLDKKKPDEDLDTFKKRVKAFEKYDRHAKEVMEHLTMVSDKFYLTHKYDKRGRCYAQGYFVTSQGSPWNKAVLEFAKQEIVE